MRTSSLCSRPNIACTSPMSSLLSQRYLILLLLYENRQDHTHTSPRYPRTIPSYRSYPPPWIGCCNRSSDNIPLHLHQCGVYWATLDWVARAHRMHPPMLRWIIIQHPHPHPHPLHPSLLRCPRLSSISMLLLANLQWLHSMIRLLNFAEYNR